MSNKFNPVNFQTIKLDIHNGLEINESVRVKLIEAQSNVSNLINALNNESSSLSIFLSDIFYWNNESRKQEATANLTNLNNLLIALNGSTEIFRKDFIDMEALTERFSFWAETIQKDVSFHNNIVTIPDIENSSSHVLFDFIALVTTIADGVLGGLYCYNKRNPGVFPQNFFFKNLGKISLILGIVDSIITIIGAVWVGEERKQAFEKITNIAKEKHNEFSHLQSQYSSLHNDVDNFFSNTAGVMQTAGITNEKLIERNAITEQVAKTLKVYDIWKNNYESMTSAISKSKTTNGEEIAEMADFFAEQIDNQAYKTKNDDVKKDIRLTLLTSYYMREKGLSPEEVSTKLGLTIDQMNRHKARVLLAEGKSPEEITQEINIPINSVLKMEKTFKLHKKANECIVQKSEVPEPA